MIDTDLVGPLKFFGLLLFLYLAYSLLHNRPLFSWKKDIRIRNAVLVTAALPFVLFVLFAFNFYDKFVILLLLVLIFIAPRKLWSSRFLSAEQTNFKDQLLFRLLRMQETRKVINWKRYGTLFRMRTNRDFGIVLMWTAAGITFISRYFMLSNDNYTLSEIWLENLKRVRGINEGIWYNGNQLVAPELFLINFYHRITGIGEEIALHTFGLIENTLVAVILFWSIAKISGSRYIVPFLGVLYYALAFSVLPGNINLFQEHNPLLIAQCFALSVFVFLLFPKNLYADTKKYILALFLLFLATAMFHFFTALLIYPVFLVSALLWSRKGQKKFVLIGIKSWIASMLCYLLLYGGIYWWQRWSFTEFMMGRLISLDAYDNYTHMVFSLDQVLRANELLFYGIALLLFILWVRRRQLPRSLAVVSCTAFMLLMIFKLDMYYLDKTLLLQTMNIFLVLLFAVFVSLIYKLVYPGRKKFKPLGAVVYASFGVLLLFVTLLRISPTKAAANSLPIELLQVYENLSTENLPFTYAVVNGYYGFNLSISEHHFMTYDAFIARYPDRDSIFYRYRDNEEYLKFNPSVILPESIYIIYTMESAKDADERLITSERHRRQIALLLNDLRLRGRNIRSHYRGNHLNVIEIINKPNASSVQEMISG